MPSSAFEAAESIDQLVAHGYLFANLSENAQATVQAAFAAGRRFFNADVSDKMSTRLPLDAGFRPYGIEFSRPDSRPDEVESFTVSGRSEMADVASLTGPGAELHAAMSAVLEALMPGLANATRTLSSRFGVASPATLEASMRQWSILQMNYSRPSAAAVEFINEEHEDGCLLTAMLNTGPGLEMPADDGSFHPVEPSPGRLVLAAGEVLWLLTGGRIPPAYHRVRRVAGVSERLSLLLFADMGPELCVPWLQSDGNRGVDIGGRVLTNAARYGLSEWTSS